MAATLAASVSLVEQVALLGAAAGVADHPGGAAGQGEGAVPGVLEAAQHDQADQVAVVEARRRRVDAVVERDRSLREPGRQRGPVGGVVHQAALVEVVEEVEHRRHRPRQPGPGSSRIGRGARSSGRACGRMAPAHVPCHPVPRLPRRLRRRRSARARTRRGPSCRPRTRRSSRPPSTPPTARSLYTFHAEENRKVIPLEQIPVHVRDAVIAIEDERFYRHNGVDVRAVLRAARTNAAAGDVEQGGSTITQQYVKQEILAGRLPDREPARCRRPRSPSSSSATTPRTASSSSTSTPSTSGTAPTGSRPPPTSTSARPPPTSPSPRAP